jgi:hypothetical protein
VSGSAITRSPVVSVTLGARAQRFLGRAPNRIISYRKVPLADLVLATSTQTLGVLKLEPLSTTKGRYHVNPVDLTYLTEDVTRFTDHVNAELDKALKYFHRQPGEKLPPKWVATMTGTLEWSIHLKDNSLTNYHFIVSPDLKMIVMTHGNNDHGPMSLDHVLLKATYISVSSLLFVRLADMIYATMCEHRPNSFGNT